MREWVMGRDAELQCLIRDSREKATGRRAAGRKLLPQREDTSCGKQDLANRYQCAWSGAGEGASAPVDLQNATMRSLYFIQDPAGGFEINRQRNDSPRFVFKE